MSDEKKPIRRALISVYDKTGLAELARGLHVTHRCARPERRPLLGPHARRE